MKKILADIQQIGANYKSIQSEFVFDSILQGNVSTNAYVDEKSDSTISMVWDMEQCVYFGGHSSNKEDYVEAVRFLKENILDEDTRDKLSMIKIYYETDEWEDILLEELRNFNAQIYWRSLYAHNFDEIPEQINADKGLSITNIDGQIIFSSKLANVHFLKKEIEKKWASKNRFVTHGFGYCAIKDKEILGWCTAEYLGNKTCGVGIQTVQEFQRQGVASILSEIFLKKCREKGLVPYWDTWKKNISSLSCAEKIGFRKVTDYKVVLALL